MKGNNYETVYILKGNLTEKEYKKAHNKVINYMKSLIKIEKVEELGLKRLAYELQKQNTGYYVDIEFSADNENIKELERLYRIDDNVLKFIVVRKDD
jgi:small subunit ribosomal protein S6